MKYLKIFEEFEPPVFLAEIDSRVEIRIDVMAVDHAIERSYRHGFNRTITKNMVVDTIDLATEEITIALMQGKFTINQEMDGFPCKNVKAGEPYRFVIKNLDNNLNVVCGLKSGANNFTLYVYTVMIKSDFKKPKEQFSIKVWSDNN